MDEGATPDAEERDPSVFWGDKDTCDDSGWETTYV
jgi:hypothetical protein